MKNKMDWFVEKYKKSRDNFNYRIANSRSYSNYGTICMPTGTGKSSVMFEDALYEIKNCPKDKKLILHFSTPILKLGQQTINDFISILNTDIIKEDFLKNKNIGFFINSSDIGNNYNSSDLRAMRINHHQFNLMSETDFDINIVASCHKSLPKFCPTIKDIADKYFIVSYIDESHLVTLKSLNDDEQAEEDATRLDFKEFCDISNKVYAFSATPELRITEFLNDREHKTGFDKYIYYESPTDAINKNEIVPPMVRYDTVDIGVDKISAARAVACLKDSKRKLPNINHKFLITCKSVEHLKSLRKDLENMGYVVFSTNSQTGFGLDENDTESEFEDDEHNKIKLDDIQSFIKAIDDYNGDCFILHIRQLIQGIDITSLTDCILFSAENVSFKTNRHTIQTIGRILRCGKDANGNSERGIPKEDRLKKYGSVYFITPEDRDDTQKALRRLITEYYGFNIPLFEKSSTRKTSSDKENILEDNFVIDGNEDSGEDSYISDLIMNIANELKEYDRLISHAHAINSDTLLKRVKKAYDNAANGFDPNIGLNTADWLTNRNIVNALYSINNYTSDGLFNPLEA